MTLAGTVVKGDAYGKVLGFPTANIDRRQYSRLRKKIRQGIYAGTVTLPNGKIYRAGIVIGPADKQGLPKLEAHLVNFQSNLYGKKITMDLKKFLRPFKTYKTEALLKQQINKDIKTIKKMNLYE